MSATSPLLAILDQPIGIAEDKAAHWSTNKFGGVPNWLDQAPSRYLSCGVCGDDLYLIAQVYAPLQGACNHRVLHLFTCIRKSCQNGAASWKVLRTEELDETYAKVVSKPSVKDEWGIGEWEDDDTEINIMQGNVDNSMVSEINMKSLSLQERIQDTSSSQTNGHMEPNDNLSLTNDEIPSLCAHYMAVTDESYMNHPKSQVLDVAYEMTLYEKYLAESGDAASLKEQEGTNDSSSRGEKYEKTKHSDRSFHRFRKTISRCPQQCMRYRWCGEPLLLSDEAPLSTEFDAIPRCARCGSERVFELQLLPTLISSLGDSLRVQGTGEEVVSGLSGRSVEVEFGSVYVFSCRQSCWDESEDGEPREEFLVVQADPDDDLFVL